MSSSLDSPVADLHPEAVAYLESCLARPERLEVPLLPTVAAQVLASTGEGFDFSRVAAEVERDQALTGHVLRIANSAFFAGRGGRVVSIREALVRLGTERVCELVLAVVMKTRLFGARGHEALAQRGWQEAVVAAAVARELGRHVRRNPEQAFLCGLLRTVGKPVILELLGRFERTYGPLDPDRVNLLLERFHPPAGARLAAAWALPELVSTAIVYQERPQLAPAHRAMVELTASAGRLAPLLLDDEDPDRLCRHPAVAQLHIYPDEARAILADRTGLLALAEVER